MLMHFMPDVAGDHDQRANPPKIAAVGPFRDVPRGIWRVYLGAWATVFGLFILFFTADARSGFMVITSVFFALMLLGLPAAMAAQSKTPSEESNGVVQTYTGPVSSFQAGIQIALVPVAAVIGLLGFVVLAM
jgi:type IV secretory pathway VirB2 component (pilin)